MVQERDKTQARRAQRIGFSHSTGQTSPVDVLDLTELRGRKMDHSMYDPTRLSFHLIQFVMAGSGRHWSDFEPVDLRAGDILFIRADQVHAFDRDSDHEALLLSFTRGALAEAHIPPPARWEAGSVLRPEAKDFEILIGLVQMQASIDSRAVDLEPSHVGPYLLAAILGGLGGVVAAQQVGSDPGQLRAESLALDFEALLDRHHVDQRSIQWYATQLQISARSLTRACQRARGSTPKRMIDLRVCLQAKRMLTTSAASVESIGLELGFSEATNFVKFFRRIVDQTPDAFRRGFGG